MQDLQVLSKRIPSPLQLFLLSLTVNTPLRVQEWQSQLESHPYQEFTQYILRVSRLVFNTPTGAKHNMQSALENPNVVQRYLAKVRQLGRLVGPFAIGSLPLHVNRLGVIPKPHQPGKWRLIVDISSPQGHSINDCIEPQVCSLSYVSIDDAVTNVMRMGKGTLLAKLDLESAYRIIPVHPNDTYLLSMEWKGSWYVDTALPFGLQSVPNLHSAG